MKEYIEYNNIKIFFRTSYFYQLRFFKKNMIPVSICIWDPKWYKGFNYKGLIPKKYDQSQDCEFCIKQHEKDENYYDLNCNYLTNYRKQLNHFNVERTLLDIIKQLDKNKYINTENIINNELYIVFMGFEIPTKKCSERFILSEWIQSYINCFELKYPINENY